ncbi:hypothetical protein BDW02DRAFT_421161 [Decorospora gaudefroyi]|uniref:Uncharacterized protein n=1 Tax=Decorospora gaudefroyi TaxID=184978 RepID=A0A6A5K7E0_9PLEO|nr:hypothetical protein BDW02DRAFT_421161 [Decorospora gaudefroyi]
MPNYYARGVSAHLGALPLAEAITPRVVVSKGDAAMRQARAAEERALASRRLKEQLVPFPGDTAGLRLNWLGNAPFIQVQAGSDLFAAEGAGDAAGARASDEALGHDKRQALVLHVELSDRSFVSGLRDQKTSLKIDVFFNGQLASCCFMPVHDVRSGAKRHHQVFAGTRIDFLAERPWIILPSGAAADGTARKSNSKRKIASAEQRWQRICHALQNEARERGTDEDGRVPPTADCLTALATMQMPEQVRGMHKPGGTVFGTVDVLITAGEGKKLTTGIGYLKAPKRLVDENYPLTRESDGAPQIVDLDAEGDSDPDYEPRPKRQALAPCGAASQHGSSSPAHAQVPEDKEAPDERDHGAYLTTVHDRCPEPPPVLHSPQLPPLPYSMQVPHPTWAQAAPSHLSSYMSFPGPASTSNPLDRFPVSFNHPPQHHSFPLSAQTPMQDRVMLASGPYMAPFSFPEQTLRGSFEAHFSPLGYHASGMPTQFFGTPSFPAPVATMLPQGPIPFSRPPLVPFPPHDGRLSGPLPPAALYTVPAKPKRSLSPRKQSRPKRANSNQAKIVVSRLVISGQNGATLVDHRWTPSEHINVGRSRTGTRQSRSVSSLKKDDMLSSPYGAEMPAPLRRSGRNTVNVNTPRPTSPTQLNLSVLSKSADKNQKDDARQAQFMREPKASSSDHNVSPLEGDLATPKKSKEPAMTKSRELSAGPTTTTLHATKQMPQRRVTPGNSILGVHGPKANPFWFEDPEEILREASARLRRSRSPIKRNNTPVTAPQPDSTQRVLNGMDFAETATSSPLTSLHTTPEPDLEAFPSQAPIQSRFPPIVQMDGSPERKEVAHEVHANASPTKLQLVAHAKCTPSIVSASNKRKAEKRSLVKEPRSPDRLKTNENPPLNQDCVIAYAESKDRKNKQGVLRQVRGERQGVFTEDYVVFACRFFVAGG